VQRGVSVFDTALGRSIGLEGCLRSASNHRSIKLATDEAGTIRAIDAMRDDEQHWYNIVSEQILYVHARAAVTLFDDLLRRTFSDSLAAHVPGRVLPISLDPPQDLHLLVDQEFTQIAKLLSPGRRRTHEAFARIRTLLALEAHVDPDVRVSTKDVQRVAKGIRDGLAWDKVFPLLAGVGTSISGQGVSVVVRFSKTDGMPVRYVKGDSAEGAGAAAIREFDLQKRFHISTAELSDLLGLTPPRCKALRDHLGIDADDACRHVFEFGSQKHQRYSDKAVVDLRKSLTLVDMDEIWNSHGVRRGKVVGQGCKQPGCVGKRVAAGKKN
jgi:hypothetical protein